MVVMQIKLTIMVLNINLDASETVFDRLFATRQTIITILRMVTSMGPQRHHLIYNNRINSSTFKVYYALDAAITIITIAAIQTINTAMFFGPLTKQHGMQKPSSPGRLTSGSKASVCIACVCGEKSMATTW